MRVLVVLAHPERQSLTAALSNVIIEELQTEGHQVQVSDLYAMGWKSQIDREDFRGFPSEEPLRVANASLEAYTAARLTEDVIAEQRRLLWADTVILQFPLWWYSMPAILKGWVDRVFSCGFAYGVGEHNDKHWGDRFGEGVFAGKRAMVVVTTGGWEEHYSGRGIGGPIDDLLFPINHGMLYYTGFDVLPPFVVYRVDRYDEAAFNATADRLRERVRTLTITEPIPYRPQNGGDYEIPTMVLRQDRCQGQEGFRVHQRPSSHKAP
ncbi:uncharacterized protein PV06_10494 [Exophiala oligosperma]|uniref:Flavodoxin-like fold domain-containing protein n=1 Tax=Exophiala oligosperma TaxID=215243 RepID=A0A0D2D553_9EURO|nr:uncharacterized protein PV06_10494 [Exophiala oligosperma]KIW37455.1 hypothetical protein PV06_10494 [Exophiala oligosperma]